jgi:hypothetical protein
MSNVPAFASGALGALSPAQLHLLDQIERYVRSVLLAGPMGLQDSVPYKFLVRLYSARFKREFPHDVLFEVLGRDRRFFAYVYAETGSRWIGLREGLAELLADDGSGVTLTEDEAMWGVCGRRIREASERAEAKRKERAKELSRF